MSKPLLPIVESAFLSLALGDAIGVPVEFFTRERLREKPVEDIQGFGTWNQMPGTFSDDTSMAFCLAESLIDGFDTERMAKMFSSWRNYGFWAAYDFPFDIGIATLKAIKNFETGIPAADCGGKDERSNGNGSLMRILPLAFYLLDASLEERFDKVKKASSVTHAHIRSIIACFYYVEFARELILGKDKFEIYKTLQTRVPEFLQNLDIEPNELEIFRRLFKMDITEYAEDEINSQGYVLDTLEASIWCLLKTDFLEDAIYKAVNLGGDTDTTGCVTGGLAGIIYGKESIPERWLKYLARKDDILDLAARFFQSLRQ